MIKWEIYTEDFEFRGNFSEASEQDIIDLYNQQSFINPHCEEQFDTEAEARAEWNKFWKDYGMTRHERGYTGIHLLRGRLAFLTCNKYTDEGDFDQGGDWYAYAIEPYKAEEQED